MKTQRIRRVALCVIGLRMEALQRRTLTRKSARWYERRLLVAIAAGLALTGVSPLLSTEAEAQILGTAETFGVLAGSTVTNTGPSVITGNLGVSPGAAVVGFPPGIVVGGTIHAADGVALQAQNDLTTAYTTLQALPPRST